MSEYESGMLAGVWSLILLEVTAASMVALAWATTMVVDNEELRRKPPIGKEGELP